MYLCPLPYNFMVSFWMFQPIQNILNVLSNRMQQKWQNTCFKPTLWEALYNFYLFSWIIGLIALELWHYHKNNPRKLPAGTWGKEPGDWDMWKRVTAPSQWPGSSPRAEPPRSIRNNPQTNEREHPRREEPFSWAPFKLLICRIKSFKNGYRFK